MRTIHLINLVTKAHIAQYTTDHFNSALYDIAANGYKAIDIKFDMDGDVIIFCIPIIWGIEHD